MFSLLNQASLAQVDTEALRKGKLTPGLHAKLNLEFDVLSGNSQLLLIKTTLRFDYLKRANHIFLVSSFQQGRKDTSYTLFVNKGFAHLRWTKSLRDDLFVEGFVQKEFNDFIHLEDRSLVGGGLRIRWLKVEADKKNISVIRLFTGSGLMLERESIKDSAISITYLVRSTNYLVFKWEPDERLLCQITTYFQLDVSRLSDFRLLTDGGITFSLTGKLSALIKLYIRYDNEPLDGIKKHDIELTNGLSYTF